MLHHSCFTEMYKFTFNNLRTNTDAKKNKSALITDISYFCFAEILKDKIFFLVYVQFKKINLKIELRIKPIDILGLNDWDR